MEQQAAEIATLADLLDSAHPFSAAESLNPSSPVSTPKSRQSSAQRRRQYVESATPPSALPKTLKPLNKPTVLLGKIILPSYPDCSSAVKCSCFRFTDGTGVVCCEILDFDVDFVGREMRVLAWNFIPTKHGDGRGKIGFLEVVRWVFVESRGENICCLPGFSSCCLKLGSCGTKCDNKLKGVVFGVMNTISPVTVVPCGNVGSGVSNVSAFLANVFVCECNLCCSKNLVSGLGKDNLKDHNFVKKMVVCFSGTSSSWHPLFSRLIGRVILLMGMKKKLVFIGKEESQLMYVTTDDSSLHVHRFVENPGLRCNNVVRGKSEFGSYTGVVVDVYMQGMVVELDKGIMLLLTDHYLTVPHSLRVGAIVTLRNIHFVDTQFSWKKILILGACCMTNVRMESFSPLETGCHLKSHSKSILQKFIDSLNFPARLWVLLVIACFRRKFSGILSDKEILGSKHKEGLAQKYASLHLPKSAFYPRKGVLVEFCRHDVCCGIKGVNYSQLRLVLPISNIISYCESSWEKNTDNRGHYADLMCSINQRKHLSCNGISYEQPIRRILSSEDIGIVALGHLKVSFSSGRLQLVDATGAVDVMFDIPPNWKFESIFEAKDFTIIMQSNASTLGDMKLVMDPLSCKSILDNAPVIEKTKISLYFYHNHGPDDCRSCSPFHLLEDYTQKLENGKYKLLILTHKFPIQLKFGGDRANRLNMFAEAIVMPWILLVPVELKDKNMLCTAGLEHVKDSVQKFATSEDHALKKCKVDQGLPSGSSSSCNYSNAENISCFSLEFPCLIAHRNANRHISGVLHCTIDHNEMINISKSRSRRLLLEFDPDSFCTYKFLELGGYYLLKHEEDKPGSAKGNHQLSHDKVFVSPKTHLWSFVFSSFESLHKSDASDTHENHNLNASNDNLMSSVIDSGNDSDFKLSLPSNALNSVAHAIKLLDLNHTETTERLVTGTDTYDHCSGTLTITPTQSFGTSCPDHGLSAGDLISLHGLVVAIHDTVTDDFPANSSLPKFLQRDNSVCIHVLVENRTVKVSGNLSKRAYPIGLGADVYATFHRVLKPRGQNIYTLTPASFITVNYTSLMKNQCSDELNYPNKTLDLRRVTTPNTSIILTSLISDIFQSSESKPVQLRCRVVSIYILVLEKIGTDTLSRSHSHSISSTVRIPFGGFILDDGSSSCCCWAESYLAATLLGLDSKDNTSDSPSRTKSSTMLLQDKTTDAARHLNQILEQHGRVVIKNHGSMFDSSNQDIELSYGSDKFVTCSDKDFLRNLILNASSLSNIWRVNASFMDESDTKWLRQRLMELDLTMPSLCNLRVTGVRRSDILEEARNLSSVLNSNHCD